MLDAMLVPGPDSCPRAQPSPGLNLFDLPPEVLVLIICKLPPVALSRFSQSCRALHDCINSLGDFLWRGLFLEFWDDPADADSALMALRAPEFCVLDGKQDGKGKCVCSANGTSSATFQWRDQVQRRTQTEKFLDRFGQSYDASSDKMSLRRFNSLATLLSVLATTPSASAAHTRSRNLAWVDKILSPARFTPEYFVKHFVHDSDVRQPLTTDRQLTAQLQVHFLTLPARDAIPPETLALARLNARAYVYNIQNYRPERWHGPFMIDAAGIMQPNWVHLAACQWVILANLQQRRDLLRRQQIGRGYPVPPLGAEAAWGGGAKAVVAGRKANPSRLTRDGIDDWAGVEGVWRRIVCFMDYRDFHEYNYHGQRTSGGLDTSVLLVCYLMRPSHDSRPMNYSKHKMFNEATRIITMALRVTRSEPADPPFEHRPRLHFAGFSVANDTMISAVHGFVCMTPSGYVRWHLVTRYESDDRWVTEAVQIGEPGSASGFIGTWTGNNHEPDDPAGPTWLWKIADVSEIPKDNALGAMNHNMFGFAEDDDDDEEDDEADEEDEDEEMPGMESTDDSDLGEDGTDEDNGTSSESDSDSDGNMSSLSMPSLVPVSTLYDLD
ncbi:hypothetical protein FRC06_006727 [Ceratobasidium sp. 370]|nr:hypothetical protein FRC06_006727 [Ceratobasidium sp. 370]